MKTKILTLLFATLTSIGICLATDYEHVKIGDLYYSLDIEKQIASVVPQDYYFESNYLDLTSAIIPDVIAYGGRTYYVKYISDDTFDGCSSLNVVTIGNNVTSIGRGAFAGTMIKSVTIPENIDTIGYQAFAYCDSLRSVTWNAKKVNYSDTQGAYNGRIFNNSPVRIFIVGEQVDSLPSIFYNYNNFGNGLYYVDTVVWKAINYNMIEHDAYHALRELEIGNIVFGNEVEYIPDNLCYDGVSRIKSKFIDIPNSVRVIGEKAFYEMGNLQSVVIGNGVTDIEWAAFADCNNLKSVVIGSGVMSIEGCAFDECYKLASVTCYANNPPSCGEQAFVYSTKIYVPAHSVDAYKTAEGWKSQKILPIGATPTTTSGVTINPSDYYVEITWSSISGAASYELVVKNKSGNVVCRVIFYANGILQSIAFHTPARNGMPQHTQEAGFSYTLIGLDSGMEYDVTITAKNDIGSALDVQTISFTTIGGEQGIEEINSLSQSTKLLRNNQILILRGGHTYTLTGQEVK